MKFLLALLPLLFLVGCSSPQTTWRVDEWGPAQTDAPALQGFRPSAFALPDKIEGDVKPGDKAKWDVTWPASLRDEFNKEFNEEAGELGVSARAGSGTHDLRVTLTLLDVGAPYGQRVMVGDALLTRQDGTLVARLHAHHTCTRGWTAEPATQARDLGRDFARWLKSTQKE